MEYKTKIAILGASGSGKTSSFVGMLKQRDFWPDSLKKIYWTNPLGIDDDGKDKCIEELKKLKDFEVLFTDFDEMNSKLSTENIEENVMIVIDDAKDVLGKKDEGSMDGVTKLFMKLANHKNLIAVIMTQVLFDNGFVQIRPQITNIFITHHLSDGRALSSFITRTLGTLAYKPKCQAILEMHENKFFLPNRKDVEYSLFGFDTRDRGEKLYFFYDDNLLVAERSDEGKNGGA